MRHPLVPLQFAKISPLAKTPVYNYELDSGMDLFTTEERVIYPREMVKLKTGIIFFIPVGYEIQIRTKSGLCCNQGLIVANSPGTVDCSYEGEVEVILYNQSENYSRVGVGFKIAQAVLCPVVQGDLIEREDWTLPGATRYTRGVGGFGSTGLT